MDATTAEGRLLDAAGRLFYAKGVQAVGMDEVRSGSGVSLKRLYQLFPSKGHLVEETLRRRDVAVRESVSAFVREREDPRERVLAVFDWLHEWFGEPDFRGCAFINAYGELGTTAEGVARIVRGHKESFHAFIGELVAGAAGPASLAEQLAILAEGAITTAAISGSPAPARQAREAARVLLDAAR
ncbi:TetR/AcrR family transcriptional regulator [Actinomadura viridis]|uniref:TetR/AcrR family transcriptional regulator n=1 Tax=Actinomadura viridis TaxID=58110 RepID=UPI00368F2767